MLRHVTAGTLLVLLAVLPGCASPEGKNYEETWEESYDHSFDFLWEQALKTVDYGFGIAERNLEDRQIVSRWDTQLAYFSTQGTRQRIIVDFEEVSPQRWQVKVSEERQVNTEQINPTASTEAEWEESEADGTAASKFRLDFERRVNPPENWRRDAMPLGDTKDDLAPEQG